MKSKSKILYLKSQIVLLLVIILSSCNPEAPWKTENVEIYMEIQTISAGFVECSFSTNKEAYYLINIEEAKEGVNPLERQKQFMMLVLDSVNLDYLHWRNDLLKNGEINIAPFSSYALQYGDVNHFFTGLLPKTDYWMYAFVVNPEKQTPEGKLYFTTLTTPEESIMDIHFDYRVKGCWDYIYPVDTFGNIYGRFPYIATTMDSLELVDKELGTDSAAVAYSVFWALQRFTNPNMADVLYGVNVVDHDGLQTEDDLEEGHTYYTIISGYDGSFKQTTVYRFNWTGDSCNIYLRDTCAANVVNQFLGSE